MQILFGKILANEIKNPGQFTLKTLRTISLMDKKVAQIFAKFCRNCFYVLDSNKNVYFGIVIDPKSKRMSPPSLEQYDINTYEMTFLEDYGLVLSSDDLALNFASTIPGNNLNYDSLIYFDRKQVIIENNNINENILEVGGKILTKAGSELFQALKVESDYKSYDNLKNYFAERNIKMYLK